MDKYISEADQFRVALTLGQLQGALAQLHAAEETDTSARLVELTAQLQKLLFPRVTTED